MIGRFKTTEAAERAIMRQGFERHGDVFRHCTQRRMFAVVQVAEKGPFYWQNAGFRLALYRCPDDSGDIEKACGAHYAYNVPDLKNTWECLNPLLFAA